MSYPPSVDLYHDPIRHPVKPFDEFYIAKWSNDQWHILRGVPDISYAAKARMVVMHANRKTDKTTTPMDYRIFKKSLNKVITQE